jgi:hypothetical protein
MNREESEGIEGDMNPEVEGVDVIDMRWFRGECGQWVGVNRGESRVRRVRGRNRDVVSRVRGNRGASRESSGLRVVDGSSGKKIADNESDRE